MTEKLSERQGNILEPGTVVDQYKVKRLIGRGGMGEVYLARDMSLGRRVALKVLHRQTMGKPETIERFFFEAKVTARFSHPNIVTIYGVGEFNGNPFVALEYLEGQALWERMIEKRHGVQETVRIGLAIAEALAEAHNNKILHRDLKPANVLIPKDGRPRVVDFGLAKSVSDEVHSPGKTTDKPMAHKSNISTISGFNTKDDELLGTPMYMAPEQWTGDACTNKTDIWALGVVLYEMLMGKRPFHESTIYLQCAKVCSKESPPPLVTTEEIPAELEAMILDCLQRDPAKRPTTAEAVSALHGIVHRERRSLSSEESPFRGLLPFTEHHNHLFYGRDEETNTFIERLREETIIPVIGASGSGKSSFMQAGVIPRLKEQGRWLVLRLRPGKNPFETLVARLFRGETGISSITTAGSDQSKSTPRRGPLVSLLEDQETIDSGLLNKIDVMAQVDEIGYHGERDDKKFLEWLLQFPSRLTLLLQQIAEHEKSNVLLLIDQLEELYTMVTDDELRHQFLDAICCAADDPDSMVRVAMTLRDDFVVRLAETQSARSTLRNIFVLKSPGPEALRQILTEPLREHGYSYENESMVDEMLESVKDEPACLPLLQITCSHLWRNRNRTAKTIPEASYKTIGGVEGALAYETERSLEGMDSKHVTLAKKIFMRLVTPEETRKVVTRKQLLEGLDEDASDVLYKLAKDRSIIVRRGIHGEGGELAEVEIVHESLIQKWSQFRRWLDESRDDITFLAEVEQAALLWKKRGKRFEETWHGDALQEAVIRARRIESIPALSTEFLESGVKRGQRRKRRRITLVATAFVILAAIAMVLAWQKSEANRQKVIAEEQEKLAREGMILALQEGARASFVSGDFAQANAKLRLSLEQKMSPLSKVLWWTFEKESIVWKQKMGTIAGKIKFSPDAKQLAVPRHDGSIYIHDVDSLDIKILRGHDNGILSLAYTNDGKYIVSGTVNGDIGVWNLENETVRFYKNGGSITNIDIDPEGRLAVIPAGTTDIKIWNIKEGVIHKTLKVVAKGVDIDAEGKRLATGGKDGIVRIFTLETGTLEKEINTQTTNIYSVAFDPSGVNVASAGNDKKIHIWNTLTGKEIIALTGHELAVTMIKYTGDGKRIVSSGLDKVLRIFDVQTGKQLGVLEGHTDAVDALDLSFDSSLLASASDDESLILWRLDGTGQTKISRGHTSPVYGLGFSPDGKTLASGGVDHNIHFWDVATGKDLRTLKGHDAGLFEVVFSPDGETLASSSSDGTIRLWNADSGETIMVLEGYNADVTGLVFSPDGETIAGASLDTTIRIYDVKTGKTKRVLRGHESMVFGIDFNYDGTTLVTASIDGTVRLWNVKTGKNTQTFVAHPKAGAWSAVFSPDGTKLATDGQDGVVKIIDIQSGESRVIDKINGRVFWLNFHPDGKRIGAPLSNGTAKFWDIESGETTILSGHIGEVNWLRLSPDGKVAATSGDDGTVRVWNTNTGESRWYGAIQMFTPPRLLTNSGWSSPPPKEYAASRWLKKVENNATAAALSPNGSYACTATEDGSFEIWDTATDASVLQDTIKKVSKIWALDTGCLVAGTEGMTCLVAYSGKKKILSESAQVVSTNSSEILIATKKNLEYFNLEGVSQKVIPVDSGVTAIASIDGGLATCYQEGNIKITLDSDNHSSYLQDVPAVNVERIIEGPSSTIIAGYTNGFVGMWSATDATLLYSMKLHGPAVHLEIFDGKLYAGTSLGDVATWNLEIFDEDYCSVLERVWARVPAIWENGRLVKRAPPQDHECFAP